MTKRRPLDLALAALCLALATAGGAAAQPWSSIDLAEHDTADEGLLRVLGSVGTGASGLPVAGGHDVDGDGWQDVAVASMRASPEGRIAAGQVLLVFGNGEVRGSIDTALPDARVLEILGDGRQEATGSEIWLDDVTGDGLGDLLIARQNFTPDAARTGAGALTLVVGSPALRALAASGAPLDLRAPPAHLQLTTWVGPAAFARLGIWMRTGDVTGDGIADLVVGADQQGIGGRRHVGAAYVVRGGPHLATAGSVDLAAFGATQLAGHQARLTPQPGVSEYHFGATCQIADLDGNRRGEVLVAAALNRAGAALRANGAPAGSAHSSGGAPRGRLYIAWDDNFPDGPWPAGYGFDVSSAPETRSIISGGPGNRTFGEEILGGLDYDGDRTLDLFVGDIVGDLSAAGNRPASGSGHVFFAAAGLRDRVFALGSSPPDLAITTVLGGAAGDIAADTAAHGDFDGDGIADLALASPHRAPFGRRDAGAVHVLFGQRAPWPARIDLAEGALPATEALRIAAVYGANGRVGADAGDTLSYSAAAGDLDADGRIDLVTNEMLGNGSSPAAEDAGNLIVLSGRALAGGADIAIQPFRERPRIDPFDDRPFRVALLGADDFDVRSSDLDSLAFGPGGAEPLFDLRRWWVLLLSLRDVNRDGRTDLLLWFDPRETGLALGTQRACLRGSASGAAFHACDAVWVTTHGCGHGWELAIVVPLLLPLRRLAHSARKRSEPG